jgi:hypothetical protein
VGGNLLSAWGSKSLRLTRLAAVLTLIKKLAVVHANKFVSSKAGHSGEYHKVVSYTHCIYCFVVSQYKCMYKIYLSLMFLVMCVII